MGTLIDEKDILAKVDSVDITVTRLRMRMDEKLNNDELLKASEKIIGSIEQRKAHSDVFEIVYYSKSDFLTSAGYATVYWTHQKTGKLLNSKIPGKFVYKKFVISHGAKIGNYNASVAPSDSAKTKSLSQPGTEPSKEEKKNFRGFTESHPAYKLALITAGASAPRVRFEADLHALDMALKNLKTNFGLEKQIIANMLIKAHAELKGSHSKFLLETLVFDISEIVRNRKLAGSTLPDYLAAYVITYRAYFPESYISKPMPDDARAIMEAFLSRQN